MKKDFLKTKNLNRSALKHINGGIKTVVNCTTLCGVAGGIESGYPGVGLCTTDGYLCCICY
ncbi:hypothetical protein [Chryseobacterium lathyri]|uniref:Bacteriocin n=1 Tax=Chryseobacterium lathyri TaxID=395933 RepID=A0ABT9SPZ4_9FLAO|nr:hypothetical protein [Chryseobacterium lathyri]MDP9961505.1 hypothetical protein [Chryseobacterium lathyri]MDQ0065404.1 hypothetical protein [Chryseobacterium lathyri]